MRSAFATRSDPTPPRGRPPPTPTTPTATSPHEGGTWIFVIDGELIPGWVALRDRQRRWWKDWSTTGTYEYVGVTSHKMQEMGKIRELLGPVFGEGRYDEAAKIFADLVNNDTFVEVLTLPAYGRID